MSGVVDQSAVFRHLFPFQGSSLGGKDFRKSKESIKGTSEIMGDDGKKFILLLIKDIEIIAHHGGFFGQGDQFHAQSLQPRLPEREFLHLEFESGLAFLECGLGPPEFGDVL